jgi:hypothetical protein
MVRLDHMTIAGNRGLLFPEAELITSLDNTKPHLATRGEGLILDPNPLEARSLGPMLSKFISIDQNSRLAASSSS